MTFFDGTGISIKYKNIKTTKISKVKKEVKLINFMYSSIIIKKKTNIGLIIFFKSFLTVI